MTGNGKFIPPIKMVMVTRNPRQSQQLKDSPSESLNWVCPELGDQWDQSCQAISIGNDAVPRTDRTDRPG